MTYEELRRKQQEHLKRVRQAAGFGESNDQVQCLHMGCTSCWGTGVKADGSPCVHCLSCPCPRCTPRC